MAAEAVHAIPLGLSTVTPLICRLEFLLFPPFEVSFTSP